MLNIIRGTYLPPGGLGMGRSSPSRSQLIIRVCQINRFQLKNSESMQKTIGGAPPPTEGVGMG